MRKNRVDNDGIFNDLHERDINFMKEVYDNSMFVANYLDWNIIQCNDGNTMRSREEIHSDIKRLIKKI